MQFTIIYAAKTTEIKKRVRFFSPSSESPEDSLRTDWSAARAATSALAKTTSCGFLPVECRSRMPKRICKNSIN